MREKKEKTHHCSLGLETAPNSTPSSSTQSTSMMILLTRLPSPLPESRSHGQHQYDPDILSPHNRHRLLSSVVSFLAPPPLPSSLVNSITRRVASSRWLHHWVSSSGLRPRRCHIISNPSPLSHIDDPSPTIFLFLWLLLQTPIPLPFHGNSQPHHFGVFFARQLCSISDQALQLSTASSPTAFIFNSSSASSTTHEASSLVGRHQNLLDSTPFYQIRNCSKVQIFGRSRPSSCMSSLPLF